MTLGFGLGSPGWPPHVTATRRIKAKPSHRGSGTPYTTSVDANSRVSGLGLRTFGFGVPASGFRARVPGLGFPGSRVLSSGFRIPECRVPASGFRLLGFGLAASGFGPPARTEGTFRPAVRASVCCLVASLVSASRRRARFWPCGTQERNRFVPECHKATTTVVACRPPERTVAVRLRTAS